MQCRGVTNKFILMSEEDQKFILCNNDLPNPKRYSRTISYNSTSPEINLTYRTHIKGFPGLRLAATLRYINRHHCILPNHNKRQGKRVMTLLILVFSRPRSTANDFSHFIHFGRISDTFCGFLC